MIIIHARSRNKMFKRLTKLCIAVTPIPFKLRTLKREPVSTSSSSETCLAFSLTSLPFTCSTGGSILVTWTTK